MLLKQPASSAVVQSHQSVGLTSIAVPTAVGWAVPDWLPAAGSLHVAAVSIPLLVW
jgi:hypothetical protein